MRPYALGIGRAARSGPVKGGAQERGTHERSKEPPRRSGGAAAAGRGGAPVKRAPPRTEAQGARWRTRETAQPRAQQPAGRGRGPRSADTRGNPGQWPPGRGLRPAARRAAGSFRKSPAFAHAGGRSARSEAQRAETCEAGVRKSWLLRNRGGGGRARERERESGGRRGGQRGIVRAWRVWPRGQSGAKLARTPTGVSFFKRPPLTKKAAGVTLVLPKGGEKS